MGEKENPFFNFRLLCWKSRKSVKKIFLGPDFSLERSHEIQQRSKEKVMLMHEDWRRLCYSKHTVREMELEEDEATVLQSIKWNRASSDMKKFFEFTMCKSSTRRVFALVWQTSEKLFRGKLNSQNIKTDLNQFVQEFAACKSSRCRKNK